MVWNVEKRVYCNECRWCAVKNNLEFGVRFYACCHDDRLEKVIKHTPYQKMVHINYKPIEDFNKNNDCVLFESIIINHKPEPIKLTDEKGRLIIDKKWWQFWK